MTRWFSWAAIAGLLIIGLAVTGCGGSGGSSTKSTATAPRITKAELVAKGNAICTAGNGPILAAAGQLATHPSRAQVVGIVQHTYVPSVESELTSIKALGAPAGEEAVVARMAKLAETDLSRLKHNPALVATDVFRDFAKVAHPYGLVACAPTS